MIKMSKMHKRVIAAHGAMLALAAVPGGAALAQTAQATELQTVTVTAQRRTENIKEVPVSVTAIKGEKLDPQPERRVLERPHVPAFLYPRLRQHRLLDLRIAAGVADL
jgi:outer membrane receptor for ferrienterochelin and colicin